MIFVGELSANGDGRAILATDVAEGTFAHFQVDVVVVSRQGEDPVEGSVLFGSPALFQRVYTTARMAQLGESDAVSASGDDSPWLDVLLGSSPAYASAPTVISPDVLFDPLVAEGAELFVNELFAGNGRTCATCHPARNNFTIDPKFIASLSSDDPLFVAEFNPALATLERPTLMRSRGLILENVDGFDDLDRKFTMRGVPHLLGLSASIAGPSIPFDNTFNPAFDIFPPGQRTGWSGDGAPGAGTLRDFATGAVVQHFPRTLNRQVDIDFRLPTDAELDALEAFQLSLGRASDIDISSGSATELVFTDPVVEQSKAIFNAQDTQGGTVAAGKCALCHNNGGANIDAAFFGLFIPGLTSGNANFGTGVNDLPNLPADLIDKPNNPRDGGFATVAHDSVNCVPQRDGFGTVTPEGGVLAVSLCEEDFNTPSLIEAADTPPFFHNNAVDTLEAAVGFYNDEAFNGSPGGQLLISLDTGGIGIKLATTEVTAVANMLRVVNAVENIQSSIDMGEAALGQHRRSAHQLLQLAIEDLDDAVEVLEGAGLHPEAVTELEAATDLLGKARHAFIGIIRNILTIGAIRKAEHARALMVTN